MNELNRTILNLTQDVENPRGKPWLRTALKSHLTNAHPEATSQEIDVAIENFFNRNQPQ